MKPYYDDYHNNITLPTLKSFTQTLSRSAAGAFSVILSQKPSDLKNLLLSDLNLGFQTLLGNTKTSPLTALFALRALRPDLSSKILNIFAPKVFSNSFLELKTLEYSLSGPSKPLAIHHNPTVPRFDEVMRILLETYRLHPVATITPPLQDIQLELFIDKSVLIPKEISVEQALEILKTLKPEVEVQVQAQTPQPASPPEPGVGQVIIVYDKAADADLLISEHIPILRVEPMDNIKDIMMSLYLPEVLKGILSYKEPVVEPTEGEESIKKEVIAPQKHSFAVLVLKKHRNEEEQTEDQRNADIYQFAFQLLLSIYHTRQTLLTTCHRTDRAVVDIEDIYCLSKELKRISIDYTISYATVLERITERMVGPTLEGRGWDTFNQRTMRNYGKELTSSIEEIQSNLYLYQSGSPFMKITSSLVKAYPLLVTDKAAPTTLGQDILSLMVRYPNEDAYEAMNLYGGNKVHYEIEKAQAMYKQIETIYKKLQSEQEKGENLQKDYKELWDSKEGEAEPKKVILKVAHSSKKQQLMFIRGLYQVISAMEELKKDPQTKAKREQKKEVAMEKVSAPEEEEKAVVEKAVVGKLKLDLSRFAKPKEEKKKPEDDDDHDEEVNSPDNDLTEVEIWKRDYVRNEVKRLNKLIAKIKKDLIRVTANIQESLGDSQLEKILKDLMENVVPKKWSEKVLLGLCVHGLNGFLEVLVKRYEYFEGLVSNKPPVEEKKLAINLSIKAKYLSLQWFSDPVDLFYRYALWFCREEKVTFKNTEICLIPFELNPDKDDEVPPYSDKFLLILQ